MRTIFWNIVPRTATSNVKMMDVKAVTTITIQGIIITTADNTNAVITSSRINKITIIRIRTIMDTICKSVQWILPTMLFNYKKVLCFNFNLGRMTPPQHTLPPPPLPPLRNNNLYYNNYYWMTKTMKQPSKKPFQMISFKINKHVQQWWSIP